jgi:transcriptional regulator with XRE-family HTH domain
MATRSKKTPGEQIKAFRKRKGLTQRELAAVVGVNVSYMNQVEGGKRGVREANLLQVFQEIIGCDPAALLAIPPKARKVKPRKKRAAVTPPT